MTISPMWLIIPAHVEVDDQNWAGVAVFWERPVLRLSLDHGCPKQVVMIGCSPATQIEWVVRDRRRTRRPEVIRR